ncbi:uncharacterized protein LOC105185868 isoform X2 [Harpegnathos saltator]|uniref:uncharacterized protein LOC105185868 isoform X2 n=1 Tax=Harpegnathos saltator TaxID=610380 RepID=UPI00058F43BB|nr:uncharacterized protein LOC105185868 isoform X2 [Harpegnathos saltator]
MVSEKLSPTFLITVFVILPIILKAQYYRANHPLKLFRYNSDNSKYSKDSDIVISESYDDPDNVKNEKVRMRSSAADKIRKPKESENNIIFPDEDILQVRTGDDIANLEYGLVPTCNEKNFCEKVPYYPTKLVNEILRNNPSLMNYATVDAVETISHRAGLGDDELCTSMVSLINPRSAKNINDDWLFIVQSEDSNFTQAVRVEICGNEGTSCKTIDGVNLGYSTTCKQKLIYRQLTAISYQGDIIRDLFPIPASCCCHLINDLTLQDKSVKSVEETSGRNAA